MQEGEEGGERRSSVRFGGVYFILLYIFFSPGYKCNAYAGRKGPPSFGCLQFVGREDAAV